MVETMTAESATPERTAALAPQRLKKRADFLNAAKGRRQHQRCFVLQARLRAGENAGGDDSPRFGFTVTKKVGNSVVRNRIRRRLREAIRLADPALPRACHDYVLVARIDALTAPFHEISSEIARAFVKIHQSGEQSRRPPGPTAQDHRQDV